MTITTNLPIEKVYPNPKQPRTRFNDASLRELAQSIKEHGLIQPIVVEETKNGWMLVAGERRLRAHKLAGMTTIEAVIRAQSNHNGREILLSGIIENVQREDMNPIDEALAYQELNLKHDMTPIRIAAKVGTNAKRVYDLLKLLKLPNKVQELIRDGKFTRDPHVTDALLKIPSVDMQTALVQRAVSKNLKIKTILLAAARLCEAVEAKPIGIDKKKIPALRLARPRADDEEQKPAKWDALVQLGKAPTWPVVVAAARETCATCELRSMANESTCGRCPAVVMLEVLMSEAKR